jgi:predicted Zn-ribbon and HTH transcriptional regulator
MTKKKYQCDECGYYWENNPIKQFPQNCPVCSSARIHQSTRHKRFAKKARVNVRRTHTTRAG